MIQSQVQHDVEADPASVKADSPRGQGAGGRGQGAGGRGQSDPSPPWVSLPKPLCGRRSRLPGQ